MPVSKKAKVTLPHPFPSLSAIADEEAIQIQREHRKGDADGTRAPVKPNGLPVKPPKPTSIVRLAPMS